MKDSNSLEQVYRLDARAAFAEVMLTGLPYDKAMINFVNYNASAQAGQRSTGEVAIWINIYEAQRLARDILSGRVAKLGAKAKKAAADAGKKYPDAVFTSIGGTGSKRAGDQGIVAREFTISPGSSQPWVLCAKQGKAHETDRGLIVMDGPPQTTVRIACSDAKLKEFALAIETVERIWEQLRFIPAASELMRVANDRRQAAIDAAKAAAAERTAS